MRLLASGAALAALALGAAAGAAEAQAPPSSPSVDVTMPGTFYSPAELRILVGTTVNWRNSDSGTHTVTADDDSFDSGYISPAGTFSHTFDKPGAWKYHCTIHRFMRGTMRVYGLVLNAPPDALRSGQTAIFTGLSPAGTTTVVLERRPARGPWQEVARRAARPDGSYAFTTPAREPAVYRARAGGRTSPLAEVSVKPLVVARLAGKRTTVATEPPRPGATAALQVYEPERFAFRTVERTKLDADGQGGLPVPAGRQHLRVVVRGERGWSDGVRWDPLESTCRHASLSIL